MKSGLYRLASFLAFSACLVVSLLLSEKAFENVLGFRQLERIPLTLLAESVGGESQVRGRVAGLEPVLLKGPNTDQHCVYYRYLVEREETDSDGNSSWRTIRDEQFAQNFTLADESGSATVSAARLKQYITWSVAQKFRQEEGSYRYTEWRVDPGDEVTVFGWLSADDAIIIDFPARGHYKPIISSLGETSERADIALIALLQLWGGVTALIAASFCMVFALRIHRTLVFLSLISFSCSLLLFHYGYRSVQADINDGLARTQQHAERALQRINDRLDKRQLPAVSFSDGFDLRATAYQPLSIAEKNQINGWRRTAWIVDQRFRQHMARFPERFVARLMQIPPSPVIAIPEGERQLALASEKGFESTRTQVSRWWIAGLLLIIWLLSWWSFLAIRTKRMQENIPTSKTAGVVYGLTEVVGVLVPEPENGVMTAPLSQRDSVWYHYLVEEKRGSGKTQKWHTLLDETKKRPFYCEDDEGKIRVFPGQAEIITSHVTREVEGNLRKTEHRLSPADELYVLGKARLDKTRGDSLVIGHEQDSPYIIANIPEEEVMVRKARTGMGMLAVSLSLLFISALLVIGAEGQMSSLDFLLASLVAPLFMSFVVVALMYNDLVFLRQRCDRNWANIQVSLKKRADLIPQLDEVVRQYLAHESQLHQMLASLRERRSSAATAADVDEYIALEHQVIRQIGVRIEQYPDLKGIDLVLVFNRRLIRLENEIALIRAGFNDAVMHYQMRIQTFPDLLLAKLFGFDERDVLRFTDAAHKLSGLTPPRTG